MKLTIKQQAFVDEYIITGNATQAAIKAGYSKRTACSVGGENLRKPAVRQAIDEKLAQLASERVATQEEILQYLTGVMRGQSRASVVVVEGCGEGVSEAREVSKAPDEKERLKAADTLAKIFGMSRTEVNLKAAVPVVITGAENLED